MNVQTQILKLATSQTAAEYAATQEQWIYAVDCLRDNEIPATKANLAILEDALELIIEELERDQNRAILGIEC